MRMLSIFGDKFIAKLSGGCIFAALAGCALEVTTDEIAQPTHSHLMPLQSSGSSSGPKGAAPFAPTGASLVYYGGKIVASPSVVQVRYGSGTYISQITSSGAGSMAGFYNQLVTSGVIDWLQEYITTDPSQGIARGTFVSNVQITPSANHNGSTISEANIQTELVSQIQNGALPAATDNTIYMIHFPAGKTITSQGKTSCVSGGFCAFHGTTQIGAQNVYYAVLPDFTGGCSSGCGDSTTFNNQTSTAGHELIETITDPEIGLLQGVVPQAPLAWYDPSYGEIADICMPPDSPTWQAGAFLGSDGFSYTVQEGFSNQHNDCVLTASNEGTGANETWTTQGYYGSIGTYFADVDNDGRSDAIAVNNSNITVRRSTGTSFGGYENWTTDPYYGNIATYFADVDGDHRADAIVLNTYGVTVRRSTGSSFGSYENWITGAYSGSIGTYFADVDGDGRADAIVVNSGGITVRRSTGSSFGAYENWTTNGFYGNVGTFFADVDGDHKADAIVVNTTGVTVRRSTGTSFGSYENWTTDPYYGNISTVFADVDGDGRADAVTIDTYGTFVRRSTKTSFGPYETWTSVQFTGTHGTFFGDVTGDAKSDPIVVNSGGITVRRSLRSKATI